MMYLNIFSNSAPWAMCGPWEARPTHPRVWTLQEKSASMQFYCTSLPGLNVECESVHIQVKNKTNK